MEPNAVDRVLGWAYRRWRSHYLVVGLLLTLPLTEVTALFPGVLSISWLAELPMAVMWRVQVWTFLGHTVGLLLAAALLLRFAIPEVAAFLRGQQYDPERLWRQLRRGQTTNALMVGPLSTGMILVALLLDDLGGITASARWEVLGLLAAGATVVTALWIPASRFIYLPITREFIARHPRVAVPLAGRRVVRLSMLLGAFCCAAFGVVTGAGIAQLLSGSELQVWATIAAMAGFGAWMALVFTVMIGRPVLDPLDGLTHAATTISAGDLDTSLELTSSDEIGRLVHSFNEMTAGLRERQRLQAAFGAYVDPALAERLLGQSDALFAGEEVEVTVMFLDVRDFTPYAAANPARAVVARLNELFELAVPVIVEHGGHANKYLGDGMMAVFGVPEPHPDHADRAVAAALEVLHAVHTTFGDELRVGIGLNTGTAIAGTLGGGGKLEFTLIGDVVNVAARVEAHTKITGDDLLLTEHTRCAMTGAPASLASRGARPLKGKAEPVELHAIT